MSLLRPRKGEGKPGRIRRALRSIYELDASYPVPPFAIRMVNGRIVGVVDARGRFFAEPACCENPMDCERPECWTHVGGDRRGLDW